jgi:hypothetical protein
LTPKKSKWEIHPTSLTTTKYLLKGGGWEIVYREIFFGVVRINDAKSKSLVERVANDPCHMIAS